VNWFWMNISLMVIFFAAVAGIPLWLVFKHPDTAPVAAQGAERTAPDRMAVVRQAAEHAVRTPNARRAGTGRSTSAGIRAAGRA
jgi:hypothetical protein